MHTSGEEEPYVTLGRLTRTRRALRLLHGGLPALLAALGVALRSSPLGSLSSGRRAALPPAGRRPAGRLSADAIEPADEALMARRLYGASSLKPPMMALSASSPLMVSTSSPSLDTDRP